MADYPAIVTEGRILMGPGPSNVHPRVLKAMGMPVVNGQVKMGLNGHEKSPQMAIELKK